MLSARITRRIGPSADSPASSHSAAIPTVAACLLSSSCVWISVEFLSSCRLALALIRLSRNWSFMNRNVSRFEEESVTRSSSNVRFPRGSIFSTAIATFCLDSVFLTSASANTSSPLIKGFVRAHTSLKGRARLESDGVEARMTWVTAQLVERCSVSQAFGAF